MSQTPPEAGRPVQFTCPNCCCSLIATIVTTGPEDAAAGIADLEPREAAAWKKYQAVKSLAHDLKSRPGFTFNNALIDEQVELAERNWRTLDKQLDAARGKLADYDPAPAIEKARASLDAHKEEKTEHTPPA